MARTSKPVRASKGSLLKKWTTAFEAINGLFKVVDRLDPGWCSATIRL